MNGLGQGHAAGRSRVLCVVETLAEGDAGQTLAVWFSGSGAVFSRWKHLRAPAAWRPMACYEPVGNWHRPNATRPGPGSARDIRATVRGAMLPLSGALRTFRRQRQASHAKISSRCDISMAADAAHRCRLPNSWYLQRQQADTTLHISSWLFMC